MEKYNVNENFHRKFPSNKEKKKNVCIEYKSATFDIVNQQIQNIYEENHFAFGCFRSCRFM